MYYKHKSVIVMYDRLRRYNMSETDQIVSKLKEICVKYTDILGLVILFGSFSRGEATKRSDIDLYVESKDLKMTTGKLMSSKRYRMFRNDLYESFSQKFDVLTFGGKRDTGMVRQSKLWREIKKDGVTIYDQGTETI